jgi:acyl-CoA thioester hydrolase
VREVRIRVRYGETDQMGVAYHGSYVAYFECARTELLRASGITYSQMERDGYFLVVTEMRIRYRASAHYDDELAITARVVDHGPATVRFAYEVRREPDPAVLVEGDTELACVGLDRRPRRLPPAVADRLGRALR